MSVRPTSAFLVLLLLAACSSPDTKSSPEAGGTGSATPLISDYIHTVIRTPPDSGHYDPFYQKYTEAEGLPITASAKVSDAAILAARDIITHMLAKRPDIRQEMIRQGVRVTIMAQSELTTDVPEQRNWKKPALTDPRLTDGERANYARIAAMTDQQYWNTRARGMGGKLTTGAEENILVHEFSHGIMTGIRSADTALYAEILAAYKSAKEKGMYKNSYASNTANEYWAEGTQWWFWSNYEETFNGQRVWSPEELAAYDPTLYALLGRVYPDHHILMDAYYAKHIPRARRAAQ